MEGLLRPKEVADILNVSLTTVHRLAGMGRLPHLWIGGQRRFRAGDVQLVLENGTAPAERRGRPRGLAVGRC
jgi:excisionase family DNA binding protein